MEQKIVQFKNRGMRQDESISKASDEFAFKNINVRITAVNDNTLFSVTNEKGPSEINLYTRLRKVPIYADYNSETQELYCYTNSPVKSDITITYQCGDWSEYIMTILSGETKSNTVNLEGSPYEPDGNFNPKHQEDSECIYYPFYEDDVPQGDLVKSSIIGAYIGKCIIDKYLIIFTKQESGSIVTNRIYRLEFKHGIVDYTEEDYIYSTLLVESNNLNILSPVETVGSYERDDIIKVYWVDGVNPNRIINIMAETQPDSFDFLPTVDNFPSVNITKQYGGNGKFPAGVIQYFISYYNKLGQETKIVAATDLQYISFKDRGGKADEIVNLSFILELSNLDTSFDYVRVYSAKRTSIDGPVESQIVGDYKIVGTNIKITDNNIDQASIDSSLLYYIGGDTFTAYTIDDKDGVLFFGNIETADNNIDNSTVREIEENCVGKDDENFDISRRQSKYIESDVIDFEYKDTEENFDIYYYTRNWPFEEYGYTKDNNSKGFKSGEFYRFAIQLQKNTGEWSEPIWIGDKKCELRPNNVIGGKVQIPIAKIVNSQYFQNIQGYKKYRLLMAETSQSNRTVLGQAIAIPTVFNILERYNDSPSFIASWFTRGSLGYNRGYNEFDYLGMPVGGHYSQIVEKQKDAYHYDKSSVVGEINNSQDIVEFTGYSTDSEKLEFCYDNKELYLVNKSVVTLHSPEISYSDIDGDNLRLNYVGIIPISNVYIQNNIQWENSHDDTPFIDVVENEYISGSTTHYPQTLKSCFAFNSSKIDKDGDIVSPQENVKYKLYAWQKTGSISGQTNLQNNQNVPYDKLKHKVFSNFIYSYRSIYFKNNTYSGSIGELRTFDSDDISAIKINNKSKYYYGNYDKLSSSENGYDVTCYNVTNQQYEVSTGAQQIQKDPVRIKYKSTKHGVFSFDSNHILPGPFEGVGSTIDKILTYSYPWGTENFVYDNNDIIDISPQSISDLCISPNGSTWFPPRGEYVMLVDIIRNGGSQYDYPTDENLQKIKWIPISEPSDLNQNAVANSGDTYYQRWDCLRTYPWTEEDENSVVDIVSFMVETHINLDGRCDVNRGYTNAINARPTNYGLMNNVYSQTNNFFEYNILDERFDHRIFPNQFAWSLNKQDVSEIDAWTSVTLSNIKNVDGSYGPINAIEKLNDTLIGFQDRAIFAINFNNRTQISTEQGLPIELANSGKVDGVTYITRNYGCKNKYSIVNAKSGIYFIDDENRALIRIGKDGLADISTAAGMSVWFRGLSSYNNLWSGGSLSNSIVLQYDSNRGDIYIMRTSGGGENDCIVYNEILQCFTSFFDNGYMFPLMYNFGGETYSLYGNSFYKMFGGTYLNNYSIDYRINPEPLTDKVFTNLEYIADCTDSDGSVDDSHIIEADDIPFSKIEVWNEYQYGSSDITEDKFMPNSYKQKFRIRRVDIPRASGSKYGMDRMRNPWIHLRISRTSGFNHKMTFHSMLVRYFK